jgi:hypothetical protein
VYSEWLRISLHLQLVLQRKYDLEDFVKICTYTLIVVFVVVSGALAKPPVRSGQKQIPTTEQDYYHPGSQPDPTGYNPIIVSRFNCINCHRFEDDQNPDEIVPPYNNWVTSMMAQSSRDPIFHASMTIANQDANDVGTLCLRCHAPGGFIQGRAMPSDGSALIDDDFDGVSCDICHRTVDPIFSTDNPIEDVDILADLASSGDLPWQPGNANYIIDPVSSRRSPLDDDEIQNMHGVDMLQSPHHEEAAFCGTCHDVSNPALSLQSDGTYMSNAMGAAHPTGNIHEMMPEQRTYSEWLNSSFATPEGVIFADGRFTDNNGGNAVNSCQDCHMPRNFGAICVYWEIETVGLRDNVPEHSFVGSNSWVLGAVRNLYDDYETGLSEESVALNHTRTESLMQKASDMELSQAGELLQVRITNWTGHSLPTGYPEGRRMWLNVTFLDDNGNTIMEHGSYDWSTADLVTDDTKVYETLVGLTPGMAKTTGLSSGKSFHLVLNNVVLSDNRIPPLGFTNAAFEAIQSAPVDYSYEDGQHWDDTEYAIPKNAAQAVVTLYHQTTTKEYIEFLRDANVTDDKGQIAYDQWVIGGMSAPMVMDSAMIDLGDSEPIPGDVNGDGVVDVSDLLLMIGDWGPCSGCASDANNDGYVNVTDILIAISNWG